MILNINAEIVSTTTGAKIVKSDVVIVVQTPFINLCVWIFNDYCHFAYIRIKKWKFQNILKLVIFCIEVNKYN